jgi:fatty-acyl-CoA synthase
VRNVRDTNGLDLSSLKSALSGAEPVRPSTIAAFESHFGLKRIISPCYGLAEATLAVAIWPRELELRADPTGRFLSVGRPCRGVSLRIVEPNRDEAPAPLVDVPATAEGEICVQSPGVMQGYYNNPAATARVLSADGWLRTGDLGFVDAEGFLYITGRIKDVIILGGENLLPADVEEVVDHVAGIRYSAAVGVESDRTGTQRLHVVAEVRDETAAETVYRDLTRDIVNRVHRARGHRPARVLLVRASTIPKTSSGKIQRSRLAQMIEAGELKDRIVHG